MRNGVRCNHCGQINPLYKLNCAQCNSILRNRVVNIELWSTLWGLLESPVKTFTNIIQAEHKNFIVFIILAAALKFYLFSVSVVNAAKINTSNLSIGFFLNILFILLLFVGIVFLFTILIKMLSKLLNTSTRMKDNFTMLLYTFLPQLVLFPLLFTIEFAVFGKYWLSFNPPPFIIKPAVAYVMVGIEFLTMLLTLLLSIVAVYSQFRLKLLAITIGMIFNFTVYFILISFQSLVF